LAQPGGSKHTGSEIVLGYAGRCPLEPTHLILNFDNSGSVGSAGGNDPIGNRFVEARLAIEAVSRRCRCDRELVSIVHFVGPFELQEQHRRAVYARAAATVRQPCHRNRYCARARRVDRHHLSAAQATR